MHPLYFSVSHSFSRCLYRPTQSPFWGMWSSEFLIPYVRFSERCYWRFRYSRMLFLRSLTLKMKSLRSLKTSVIIYQSSQYNILRDLRIRFPSNTARLLFALCRNIPVLNTACLLLVHAETCSVPNSEVRYRVRRDNRGRRNLLLRLADVMADWTS